MATDDEVAGGPPHQSVAELLAGYLQTLAELRRRGGGALRQCTGRGLCRVVGRDSARRRSGQDVLREVVGLGE